MFLVSETQVSTIEASFQEFTERKDIAILLINQHVCPDAISQEEYLIVMLRPFLLRSLKRSDLLSTSINKPFQPFWRSLQKIILMVSQPNF